MSLRLYIIILFATIVAPAMAQQDPQFNQYMFNTLGINPGYAGSRDAVSAVILNRTQWLGFKGAPQTQSVAIHAPFVRKKVGLGLQITNDIVGPRNTLQASAVYAYRIRIGHGKLAFGLRSGILNYTYDPSKVDYRDVDDPINLQGVQTITKPNFDFGLFYHTKRSYAGLEIAHLNQPEISFLQTDDPESSSRLRYHLTGIIGHAFVLTESVVFRPSILVKQPGAQPGFVDLNANFLFNKVFWIGGGVRPGYGGIIITEYTWNNKIRLGYSFDYALNPLFGQSYGSHEIFLGFDLNISTSKMTSPRYF